MSRWKHFAGYFLILFLVLSCGISDGPAEVINNAGLSFTRHVSSTKQGDAVAKQATPKVRVKIRFEKSDCCYGCPASQPVPHTVFLCYRNEKPDYSSPLFETTCSLFSSRAPPLLLS